MTRFWVRVRSGYLDDPGYAMRKLRASVENAGGRVESFTELGGEWDVTALVGADEDGAVKLAFDSLESDGLILEFDPLGQEPLDSAKNDGLTRVLPDSTDASWRAEALWWEDWSRRPGSAGEIQRVVTLAVDELGLDAFRLRDDDELAWEWTNAWVWDPSAPAVVGPTAAPPDGWSTQGLGKWIARAVRVGFRLSPVGRAIEIAAAGMIVGKEIHKVARSHLDRTRPSPRPVLERRHKMHYVEVRQRIVRTGGPRGQYFQHYYERHERWRRVG